MDKRHAHFRDRLLREEPAASTPTERYEREVHAMLEQKLTRPKKIGHIVIAVVMAALALQFGYLAVGITGLPVLARIGFAIAGVFSLGFFAYTVRIVRKGRYNARHDANRMIGMVWGFMVIFVVISLFLSQRMEGVDAVKMLVNVLFFWIMAAVFLLKNRIDQSELTVRENLLRVEQRLAEMAETMQERGGGE